MNKLNTYSTEETKVGTWIDGKPLYRKVFTGTSADFTNSSTFKYVTLLSSVDSVVNYNGYTHITSSNNKWSVPSINVEDSGEIYYNRIINRNKVVRFEVSLNSTINNYVIWIEYTKTTD